MTIATEQPTTETPTGPLIGLIGKKRAGKDTVAYYLEREHGYQPLAFAARVRRVLELIDPYMPSGQRLSEVLRECGGWDHAKDDIPEARRLLRVCGGALCDIDPHTWIRPVMRDSVRLRRQGLPVVISDVRLPREALAITDAGGSLIRVKRDATEDGDTHITETALDFWPVHCTIDNGGTLEALGAAVDTVLTYL